jgi:endonuclease YncB( thermonuclease family)
MTIRKATFALVASALLLGISLPSAAESFTAKVRNVSDGDTLVIRKGVKVWVVQLAGIDAPEMGQDFGADARGHLIKLVEGRSVDVEVVAAPRTANLVAHVSIDGQDLAASLVATGLAWADADESSPAIRDAEKAARESNEGLWASADPKPPWTHRADA